MIHGDHSEALERAFSAQASSFASSAVANAGEVIDAILEAAQPRRDERWLEAACGPGIVSRSLGPHVEAVHGVDVTGAMIQIARDTAAAAGLRNVTFEVADARLPGSSWNFDGDPTGIVMVRR